VTGPLASGWSRSNTAFDPCLGEVRVGEAGGVDAGGVEAGGVEAGGVGAGGGGVGRTDGEPLVNGLSPDELPPPGPPPVKRNLVREYVPPIGVFVAFLVTWCLVHTTMASYRKALLPYPWDVITHGFTEKGEPKNPRQILNALVSTMRTSIGGLLAAIVIGGILAVIMSRSTRIEKALYPYAVALQTIPIIALVPLFYVFTGSGYMSRTLVCVLIAVFPIIVNTLFGLKSPDRGMHDLFTLHGSSQRTRLNKLEFPAALPAMFEGFRISAGLSVIGAIVSEIYFKDGPRGLGGVINLYNNRGWYPQMYAAIFVTAVYGLFVFAFFGILRNLVIGKWNNTKR
jgi:NitT/TauT family transport system permease protein